MASISRDFDEASLQGSTVRVDGTTKDHNGAEVNETPTTEMYVAIVGVAGISNDPAATPLQAPHVVKAVLTGARWSATFPDVAPPLHNAQVVLFVGLALRPGEEPFVWQERLPIISK